MNWNVDFKRLTPHLATPEYRMMKDINSGENGFNNPPQNMSYYEFKDWLRGESNRSNIDALSENEIAYTTYVLYVCAEPVGYGRVIHKAREYLNRNEFGPIEFAIAPEHRGNGYGKLLFSMLLQQCKELGYKSMQFYPRVNNVAENQVLLKNGGKIVGQIFDKDANGENDTKNIVLFDWSDQ